MTKIDDGPWTDAGAEFSVCGRFRYRLWREWKPRLWSCAFVMLNPSVADHLVLDPTVRRCIRFAEGWGCGRLEVVNLYPMISTDPVAMFAAGAEALGERDGDWVSGEPGGLVNDKSILEVCRRSRIVVAAWGASGPARGRALDVAWMLIEAGVDLQCLGTGGDRAPRHPLYVPARRRLESWPPWHPTGCRAPGCRRQALWVADTQEGKGGWRVDAGLAMSCEEHALSPTCSNAISRGG